MGNGSSRDQEDIFENEVNLFQFKLLKVIGKGSFGKVRMVERRETGKVYALKYISKAQVIKMDAVRNILRERQILETLDHAFVVNMRFAFQDDEYMYMCMDLMMGGDLRFHTNRKSFGEDVVRFWIAEMSSAINHLHSLGIVHRDIKPDNVLLDADGHAHLTDFNIGCKLTEEKPVLTSQSGTVAYMAPEVFKGTGYGTSVDWWAMGVVFYECIYGHRPFQTESIADLKVAICNQAIEYPAKEHVSRDCISLIREFLVREPSERLGTRTGISGIRQHPFFHGAASSSRMSLVDWWHLLETKQLAPPFKPSSEHNNFDTTYDLEELLMDDEPLTYRSTRKRAQRMQRERDRAIKEENARVKAENEAAALLAAEMTAMNLTIEEAQTRDRGRTSPPKNLNKKESKLGLGGRDQNQAEKTLQAPLQTQPLPLPAQQPHCHPNHTLSQLAKQTQFQSIPLSPIDGPTSAAGREFPVPTVPALRFPSPPPGHTNQHDNGGGHNHQTTPPLIHGRFEQPPVSPPDVQSSSFYHRPSSPTSRSSMNTTNSSTTVSTSGSTMSGYSYSTITGVQNPGVTAVYLSQPTISTRTPKNSSPNTSKKMFKDDQAPTLYGRGSRPGQHQQYSQHSQSQQQQTPQRSHPQHAAVYAYQNNELGAARPQQVISADHSLSRQKHIPSQQPLPAPVAVAPVRTPPRRATTPTPQAMNIAAAAAAASAAAALANMSPKEKIAYMLDLIDREFTTFDYTVYESYHGLVDPVTMSVGDPPEWVRSRDQS
ncbi:AGC/YANK protein kinase [Podila verticillata NRRL 6337]|nr:AGC/YANK protein kinase [Podila verticillata NRRL 6337]